METEWRIPDRLQSWYRVCGSRELPAGKVLRWDLPGRSFAVYRGRIRLEILFSILMQATIVRALDLSLAGWLACYAAFALNWSSLQYADHAWSVRDVHDGAWNLRVNGIVRYLFLNYHPHRAHHQHPSVPWLHLPKYVDVSEERPSFLRTYLRMWRGPRPWPGEEAP
jgi:hypothetical protein